ncbi:hypothetical protein CHF27_004500 [Romboutsia maritimum]|uniref:Uncharacterized protein n=1 Tax=Romboutsia maritimum TaxID=2020948 RepID=A0A255I129_9FIRM|nr:hypothetical protein [Romboutsia maritimum]RDY24082.1 hypothetical protein CHF27_004500 [Romboutsia maritimum]
MRWTLVFLFLYFIPLIILFRNYKNFRRSCIYGSIYVVLATTIVISNMYMSGLNKIKEALYYQSYASDERYKDKYVSNFDKQYIQEDESEKNIQKENNTQVNNDTDQVEEVNEEKESKICEETDSKKIYNFKKDIYDIERVALIPMRECMVYTKDIYKNLHNIRNIKEDIEYAQYTCKEVVKTYNKLDIPTLSNEDYTKVLVNAKNDVKKAYELREKAMESANKLIETKNPKYIGKLTEYLHLSDKQIESFKERLNDLKEKIDEN